MLDRSNPGANSVLNARRGLRMRHDEDSGGCGLLDQHLELIEPEVRVRRLVARREDATGGRHFDDIGAHANESSHGAPHLVDTVDQRVGHSGMARQPAQVHARCHPRITVTPGLPDHTQADLHPRSRDQLIGDGLLDAQIRPTRVTHRGDADPERCRQVLGGLVEPVAERRLEIAHLVNGADDDVGVAVEQARQEGLAGQINLLVAIQTGSDFDDASILDDQIGLRRW